MAWHGMVKNAEYWRLFNELAEDIIKERKKFRKTKSLISRAKANWFQIRF